MKVHPALFEGEGRGGRRGGRRWREREGSGSGGAKNCTGFHCTTPAFCLGSIFSINEYI